jgi:hypothetical protein
MSTYRCNPCSTNWPPTTEFQDCPECQARTAFGRNADPIDLSEALSRKRHADFNRFYEDREAKRLADEIERIEQQP